MIVSAVFRPQAEDEIIAAQQWYEDRAGLGATFADAVDDVIARIERNPLAFPKVHGEIRRAVMRQFPYGIYFQMHGQNAVILAVIHGQRHPARWQTRR